MEDVTAFFGWFGKGFIMFNSVHVTAMVAYVGEGFTIIDADGVFIRCIGVEPLPLASVVDIRGRLINVVRRNVAHVVIDVDTVEAI